MSFEQACVFNVVWLLCCSCKFVIKIDQDVTKKEIISSFTVKYGVSCEVSKILFSQAGKMARGIQLLVCRPEDISLISRSHKVSGRADSCELTSDLYIYIYIFL